MAIRHRQKFGRAAASHLSRAVDWHFGQLRLRHVMG
jgi:hypothetical protein